MTISTAATVQLARQQRAGTGRCASAPVPIRQPSPGMLLKNLVFLKYLLRRMVNIFMIT